LFCASPVHSSVLWSGIALNAEGNMEKAHGLPVRHSIGARCVRSAASLLRRRSLRCDAVAAARSMMRIITAVCRVVCVCQWIAWRAATCPKWPQQGFLNSVKPIYQAVRSISSTGQVRRRVLAQCIAVGALLSAESARQTRGASCLL
jgi:hypothetical protein